MKEFPGQAERILARTLIQLVPEATRRHFTHDGVDLGPAAEHVLYTTLRQRTAHPAPSAGGAIGRTLGRLALALGEAATHKAASRHGGIAVLVTQPVHVTLFAPIAAQLEAVGERRPLVVVARTGIRSHPELGHMVDLDLRGSLRAEATVRVAAYGVHVTSTMRSTARAWEVIVGPVEASRLARVLQASLPRLALDAARLNGLVRAARPRVIACFSEVGILARLVPAVAAAHGIPSADLPHAEAADPWGSAGMGYDTVGVYGPHSASVLELAGIAGERIVTLGPLPYDALLRDPGPTTDEGPDSEKQRRILFASQPVDPGRPYLAEPVKRLALDATLAAAEAVAPAEVIVLPHPTEDRKALDRLTASMTMPANVALHLDPPGQLHERLRGAFLLVTASSQSVFEAVVASVPAIAVHLPESAPPVTFVDDGIALGADSPAAASEIARRLADPAARAAVARSAREALDPRLGPLDGRSAERAAWWLHNLGR